MIEELIRLLVHAHHRPGRIVGEGVGGEDVLHCGDERGVRVGWDRPALLQMRTKFRFFKSRPMLEWSRSGTSSIKATCFSNSRSDQRVYPGGGAEQASAITRASTSPVITDGTGGVTRSFRVIVASASPPVITNRFAIWRTVSSDKPTWSATTARSGTGP